MLHKKATSSCRIITQFDSFLEIITKQKTVLFVNVFENLEFCWTIKTQEEQQKMISSSLCFKKCSVTMMDWSAGTTTSCQKFDVDLHCEFHRRYSNRENREGFGWNIAIQLSSKETWQFFNCHSERKWNIFFSNKD